MTTNGKEASFLAGGEFPVPVLQGGGNAGAVTIQFREFGIRLKFLPIITANGTIKMHVQNELSTIDLNNAVVFFRLHDSGAGHAACGNRCRAGRRAELCDRRSD